MNPATPLLVAALAGAALCGRRGWPWLAGGLLATALLLPVLARPDAIPSPAATLAVDAPWQGTASPADGNPVLRDATYEVQPWLLYLRHELRAGRLPFWNPYQGAGTPYWGNGSSAPLFPLHLLFVALPLQIGWVLLPWLRLATAGAGAWMLARALGNGPLPCAFAATAYALSGMLVSFALYPMGSALALLPWVLWAVERIAAGTAGWRPLALLGGLQLLAGHPETCAHTALLGALYLAVRIGWQPWRTWARFAGGFLAAGALGAVHVLPFLATVRETSRWQQWAAMQGPEPPLSLLLRQPLRLLLPQLYGDPARGTWWGPFNYVALAAYCGALTLLLALAGAARWRRDRRVLALVAVLALSVLGAYHAPVVRTLLNLLPFVGRALHHRLVMGIELALAMLAAGALEAWLRGERTRAPAFAALAGGALLAVAWALFHADWRLHATLGEQARWTAWALVAAALVALLTSLPARARPLAGALLVVLTVADLCVAHGRINPHLPAAALYPETGATRFLRAQGGRVAGIGGALHPNAGMVYGIADVRTDDSVKLARYERVNAAALGAGHPTYFVPIQSWSSPWLDDLGVRWVIAAPGVAAPVAGWSARYVGTDATVYERPAPLPLVRWESGAASGSITVLAAEPGRWRLAFRATRPDRLVVAEVWDRGWSATVDARAEAVQRYRDTLLAVPLAAGSGIVELRYRPVGWAAGATLSAAALLVILVPLLSYPGTGGRRNRTRSVSSSMRDASRTGRTRETGESCQSTPTSTMRKPARFASHTSSTS